MYFLKCILCDTPIVTYAMQKCMGKIEFMAKMSNPTYFLTIFKHWFGLLLMASSVNIGCYTGYLAYTALCV